MIPSKGVTCLMSVSPVGVTSVVISCLADGTRVSFHSGSFIDEGVGGEGLFSRPMFVLIEPLPNICLSVVVQIMVVVGPLHIYGP